MRAAATPRACPVPQRPLGPPDRPHRRCPVLPRSPKPCGIRRQRIVAPPGGRWAAPPSPCRVLLWCSEAACRAHGQRRVTQSYTWSHSVTRCHTAQRNSLARVNKAKCSIGQHLPDRQEHGVGDRAVERISHGTAPCCISNFVWPMNAPCMIAVSPLYDASMTPLRLPVGSL